jgi:hypothetical protein
MVLRQPQLSYEVIEKMAEDVKASKLFPTLLLSSQIRMQIMMGQELGFGPMASLTAIQMVKGRPCISAGAMAALIKRSGKYTYITRKRDLEGAEIEFFEQDPKSGCMVSQGTAEFTADDASRTGNIKPDSGWTKYPKAMLWARALSDGFRRFCGDLTMGPVYTPEEMGGPTDESDLQEDTADLVARQKIMDSVATKLKQGPKVVVKGPVVAKTKPTAPDVQDAEYEESITTVNGHPSATPEDLKAALNDLNRMKI